MPPLASPSTRSACPRGPGLGRAFVLLLLMADLLSAAGCDEPLPGFANPPPYDAGPDLDAGDDEDSGR